MDIQTLENKQSYNVLLLGDFHMQEYQIGNLIDYYNDLQLQHPDYVLLVGDFDNLPNIEQSEFQDEQVCKESEQRIAKMLKPLIEYFQDSIFYFVPGNHDPYSLFYPNQEQQRQKDFITQNYPGRVFNVHNQIIDLGDNLKILGFGGSIPGFEESTNEKCWDGFPFEINDDQFKNELQQLIREKVSSDDQLLLMTHIGPHASISSQSRFTSDNSFIQTGSQYIADIITDESKQYNVIANVHGHVHDAQGQSIVKNTKIVNAGPISMGQFTQIQLRINKQNQWKVVQTQCHDMN